MVVNKMKYRMVDNNMDTLKQVQLNSKISRGVIEKLYHNERIETIKLESLFKVCEMFHCKLSDLIEFTPDEK